MTANCFNAPVTGSRLASGRSGTVSGCHAISSGQPWAAARQKIRAAIGHVRPRPLSSAFWRRFRPERDDGAAGRIATLSGKRFCPCGGGRRPGRLPARPARRAGTVGRIGRVVATYATIRCRDGQTASRCGCRPGESGRGRIRARLYIAETRLAPVGPMAEESAGAEGGGGAEENPGTAFRGRCGADGAAPDH